MSRMFSLLFLALASVAVAFSPVRIARSTTLKAETLSKNEIKEIQIYTDPKSVLLSANISKMNRLDIIEQVICLEKKNPTENPASRCLLVIYCIDISINLTYAISSPLINGDWKHIVSGFGLPGLIIYQVGSV